MCATSNNKVVDSTTKRINGIRICLFFKINILGDRLKQRYENDKRLLFYNIALNSKIINPSVLTKSISVRIRLIIILLFFYISCFAQDPEFSQFYANPLYYNPAFAGVKGGPRFILNFRDQWPSLDAAFVTYTASYDQFFEKIRSGIGISLMGDNQGSGIYSSYEANLMYSYQIRLSDNFNINVGINGGYFERIINWSDAIFGDQLNPLTPYTIGTTGESPLSPSFISGPDFGTGILAYNNHIYFGASLDHIFSPKESFLTSDLTGTIPIRFAGNFGYEVSSKRDVDHNFFFSPNLIYLRQAGQNQLNVGAYAGITPIFIGFYYRDAFANPDAFIILVGFTEGIFKIAYSYDITVSGLSGNTGGAHELSLIVNLSEVESATKEREDSYKRLAKCPIIF